MTKAPKDNGKKAVRGGRAGRVKGQLRPFGFKPNSSGRGKGPPEPPKGKDK